MRHEPTIIVDNLVRADKSRITSDVCHVCREHLEEVGTEIEESVKSDGSVSRMEDGTFQLEYLNHELFKIETTRCANCGAVLFAMIWDSD